MTTIRLGKFVEIKLRAAVSEFQQTVADGQIKICAMLSSLLRGKVSEFFAQSGLSLHTSFAPAWLLRLFTLFLLRLLAALFTEPAPAPG